MDIKINDDLLLNIINKYIDDTSSGYFDGIIDDTEILGNVYKHIDKNNINAVLLRGSRATNRNNPESDVDVVVLAKIVQPRSIIFKDSNRVRYNIRIFDDSFLNISFKTDDYRFFYGMRILLDKNGIGKKLIDRINEYERYVCSSLDKLNPEYKDYLYELLEFVEGEDELLSKFAKAKILYESPAYLARFNGYNLIGFKTIIDCLVRDNPDLANIYLKALSKDSKKQDIKDWIDSAFKDLCGIDVLNSDFNTCKKSYDLYINGKSMYCLYNDYYTFFKLLEHLRLYDLDKIDFLYEIKEKAPKLFNKLWSYIK